MQPTITSSSRVDPFQLRQVGSATTKAPNTAADPSQLVARGPLAARAHRLLGLGAVGSAQLGQSQPAMQAAFGGDAASWQQVGTPWIAARSLARPTDAVPAQSSAGWLLSNAGSATGGARGPIVT